MYAGFPVALIPHLACPNDGASFSCAEDGPRIMKGTLCCRHCSATYSISNGVACLLGEVEDHVAVERVERDRYAAVYDAHLSERFTREVPSTMAMVGSLEGLQVVEYGAGTGRFTELLSRHCAGYIALDMSYASLRVLAQKNIGPNVGLVQGDASAVRFAPNFFDRALSFQVIEHMHADERTRFYAHVRQSLKKDGELIVSAYHHDLRRRLRRLPQEGAHDNGIFYHYFTGSELRRELRPYFSSITGRPIDITLPFCGRFNSKLQGMVSRMAERAPALNLLGHLYLFKARV